MEISELFRCCNQLSQSGKPKMNLSVNLFGILSYSLRLSLGIGHTIKDKKADKFEERKKKRPAMTEFPWFNYISVLAVTVPAASLCESHLVSLWVQRKTRVDLINDVMQLMQCQTHNKENDNAENYSASKFTNYTYHAKTATIMNKCFSVCFSGEHQQHSFFLWCMTWLKSNYTNLLNVHLSALDYLGFH